MLEWQRRVGNKISPFTPDEELADSESLMKQLVIDQEVMKEEASTMQFKEAKARRRAKERLPGRSKEQNIVRRHHGIFAAAYGDAIKQKSHDRVTTATAMAMELLDLSFSDKAIQIIRRTKDWVETLRNEPQMQRRMLNLLEQKQLCKEKGHQSGAKKYIFEYGIKGIRRVIHKYGTVSTLQQVEWECPMGVKCATRRLTRGKGRERGECQNLGTHCSGDHQ